MKTISQSSNVLSFCTHQKMFFKVDILVWLLNVSFFLITMTAYSQSGTQTDSLLKVYNSMEDGIPKIKILEELFYANVYNNPYEGENYARLAESLSIKLNNIEGQGVAMYHIGVGKQLQTKLDSALIQYQKTVDFFKTHNDMPHYASTISAMSDIERRRGNFDVSISYNKEATQILKSVNDQLRYGIGIGNLGNIYYDMGNNKLALEKSIEALKILDTVQQEPWRKADLMRQIGRIELDRENYEESLRYLNLALEKYEEFDDNIWQAYTLTDIGNNYLDTKKFDEAKEVYLRALEIANVNDLSDTKANTKENLAVIESEKGNYNRALKLLNEALELNRSVDEMSNIASNLNIMARIQRMAKNYSASRSAIIEGLTIVDTIVNPMMKKNLYYQSMKLYEAQNLYKNALEDAVVYITLNDSLNKINNAKQTDALRIAYETEQKEKEILLKNNEIELLEARKTKAENQRLFFIIILIGILLIGLALFYGLRQKLKRNKIEREKLDKELSFKEKELTTHALHLAHKNEVLLDLKSQIKDLKKDIKNPNKYQRIINNINLDINNDSNWEQFRNYFEDVHKDFNSKIINEYPEVSNNDLRLMSLLKMNLSSKEIANILNISVEGVKKARYRLRKKLNLNSEDSLSELIINL